jgi:hypothetical protein
MASKLIYRSKYIYGDGTIREMVLWQLSEKTEERPHGFKYRLHYGDARGGTIVRYDNETGKGDHGHIRDREERYLFKDVETLVSDFLEDIKMVRRGRL